MEQYKKYAAESYPSNHTYKIKNKNLYPKCKLALRYKKIKKLFPPFLTSLVDIGCSKGFFVFAASQTAECTRSVGVDIDPYEIQFCQAVKKHLGNEKARFELLQLHAFANQIDQFGGPFQTVLLINTYQYLYFGSQRSASHYSNHDEIFKSLRTICSQRVIFNNRVDLSSCQNIDEIHNHSDTRNDYNKQKILESASRYFSITKHGQLGRYPLWTLDI